MSSFKSVAEIRQILKAAGYTNRLVSVKQKSSIVYIAVTIKDASVSLHKIKQLLDKYNTWQMDVSDYVTGQSIEIRYEEDTYNCVSKKYREIVLSTIDEVEKYQLRPGQGVLIGNVAILSREANNMVLTANKTYSRHAQCYMSDLLARDEYVINAMCRALHYIHEVELA